MHNPMALWAAMAMVTVGLAGCTSGELDMLVTPSDDAVTEPYLFQATGPAYERYVWDFGDGVQAEGKEVEHLFGFTNGDIIVQLTGHNEGEEPVRIARTVDLGGVRNTNPEGSLTADTYWIDPGEPFLASSAGSSDPDGDPLLYRWTCERISDLVPPDTSHPPHEGLGGVPFGVDAWAELDINLTAEATDHGSDFCATHRPIDPQPWSTTATAVQATITESGFYAIELLVRDPKGTPWTGRLNMVVSDPDRLKPNETYQLQLSGSFEGGSGGSFQDAYENGIPITDDTQTPPPSEVVCEADDAECERNFDRLEQTFFVVIPSKEGTIDFSYEGGTADGGSTVEYEIFATSSGSTVFGKKSEPHSFGKDTFTNSRDGSPREYTVVFTLTNGGQLSFDFDLQMEHDIDPLNWYERF